MTLYERIENDLHNALKAHNTDQLDALRLLKSSLQNYIIERRAKGIHDPLGDKECEEVIRREIKKRKEAATLYASAGRADLEAQEIKELTLFEPYLPPQMSDDDLMTLVESVLKEKGAVTEKDFGMLMKEVIARAQGGVDGGRVSDALRKVFASRA